MKTTSTVLALGAALAMLSVAPADAKATAPPGVWVWDTGEAAVEFHPCGLDLCGRIVWVKEDQAPPGAPLTDRLNPDPGLRARTICGIDYITGLKETKAGAWRRGRVYDFKTGKSYDLDLDAIEPTRVRMRGYMGVRMLGADLTLVRAETPPSRPCSDLGAPRS